MVALGRGLRVVSPLLFAGACVIAFGLGSMIVAVKMTALQVPWWRSVRVGLVSTLTPYGAAAMVFLAGTAATIVVGWPLGEGLAALESTVDTSALEWAQANQISWLTDLSRQVTVIGDRPQNKAVLAVASVVFAALWWRRGWWKPPLVLGVVGSSVNYLQQLLSAIVDRGHPPTSTGSYPSGGCLRLLAIYGTIFVLATYTWRISRRWQVVGWTIIGVALGIEAFTRAYLMMHWLTDVVGGCILAVLFAAICVATVQMLMTRLPQSGIGAVPTQRSGESTVDGGRHRSALPAR